MDNYQPQTTPLIKLDKVYNKFGLVNLLVKDESKNKFNTWKDRRSKIIIEKAKDSGIQKVCIITSGNAGYSLAKFGELYGIKVIAIIDESLKKQIKNKLTDTCLAVIETNLSKSTLNDKGIQQLLNKNPDEIIWDVSNGHEEAYKDIIDEIKDEKPDYIVCPVGSGECFIGLSLGIEIHNLKTKLIGVTPTQNPSFADKLARTWTPYTKQIKRALNKGHQIINLSEDEIKNSFYYAKELIDCEPSSAVVFGAISKMNFKTNDKIILINSGKGLI